QGVPALSRSRELAAAAGCTEGNGTRGPDRTGQASTRAGASAARDGFSRWRRPTQRQEARLSDIHHQGGADGEAKAGREGEGRCAARVIVFAANTLNGR